LSGKSLTLKNFKSKAFFDENEVLKTQIKDNIDLEKY
jgi:hypothetical protein